MGWGRGLSDGRGGRGQREGSPSGLSFPLAPAVLVPTRLEKPQVHPTCFLGDDILGLFTEAG